MQASDLKGAFTALATPFRDGELDLESFARLLDYQLEGRVAGLVPCGTTGESPTLTAAEQRALISATVSRAKGKALVLAGTGTNSTRETIERTLAAQELGVDGAMIVLPYYNKPTQAGLVAHVCAVHDATKLPLVVYNVPSRTASDLLAPAMIEIARRCPRVIGLKEATGNVLRAQQVVAALGDRLSVLSGDDALTLGIMACGGRGVISVASNVAPAQVQGVADAMLAGELTEARRRHFALGELYESLFLETNPGPVKAGLAHLGLLGPELRLPLVWPTAQTRAAVTAAMDALELRASH